MPVVGDMHETEKQHQPITQQVSRTQDLVDQIKQITTEIRDIKKRKQANIET